MVVLWEKRYIANRNIMVQLNGQELISVLECDLANLAGVKSGVQTD